MYEEGSLAVAAAFQRQPFVMIPPIGAGFRDALLKCGRCAQIWLRLREDRGEVCFSTPTRVSAPRRKNPDAEKRDLSVQIDSEAASLPIRIEKALRQLCRPLECFSDDGGSSSH